MYTLVFIATPLLFPTGRLPSTRWRPVAVVAAVTAMAVELLSALQPTIQLQDQNYWFDNPIGLARIPDPDTAVAHPGGAVHWLHCGGSHLAGAAVPPRPGGGAPAAQVVHLCRGAADPDSRGGRVPAGQYRWCVGGLIVVFVPVAAGIAILRFRLYDIDRLINRTLVYGTLTALLGGVYAVAVLVLGQLFGGVSRDPPSWAVAGATLAVAALFQPARRRIQAVVDRRFNRQKYDAARTVEVFTARLREEIDLAALSEELLAVVDQTMEPTQSTLWLQPSTERMQRSGNLSGSIATSTPA